MASVPSTWFSTWAEIHSFELGLLLSTLVVLLRREYRPVSHALLCVTLAIWVVPPSHALRTTVARKPWYYLLAVAMTETMAHSRYVRTPSTSDEQSGYAHDAD
ncbi:hypothetical protein BG842_07020 [Haladaptatus sp. W1]|uniref:hypothetical protein n=1 Tax=Haladaptatus sp. W1 TaxID=1897478 RepID=UPI0008497A8B|nr:hypothetical protein [Haladaptatus sp. W1]ODR79780.1 hypothetical protein BG842_07020 [Haladaptatus sp. W1]